MVNKFIKGKWYKGEKNDYYIKFSHLEDQTYYNRIYASEYINRGVYKKEPTKWANTEFEIYALKNPVTIEELRLFLPKNHPDLQLNNIIELW
jgi:hypothetical protein